MQLFRSPNRFVVNVLQVFRGAALSQLILIAATPILTRLFLPDAFGEFVTYQAVLTFALVGSAFRYEYAVLLPADEKDAASLVLIGVIISTILSLLLAVSALVSSRYVSLLAFMAGALFLGGVFQTLSYWVLRRKDYRLNANAKIVRASVTSVAGLAGGFLAPVGSSLIIADVVGRLAAAAMLAMNNTASIWRHLSSCNFKSLLVTARKYRAFPLVSLPGSMVNTAAFALTPVLIAYNYGLAVAGSYALVDRVLGAPSALVGTSVGQVYMSEMAEIRRRSPRKLRSLFVKVIVTQAKLAVIPLSIVAVFAPYLFELVFGDAWYAAGVYVRYLAVLYFLGFVCAPVSSTLTLLELQGWQFAWDSVRLITVLLAWYSIALFELRPELGLLVYALTMSVFIVIYIVLCLVSFSRPNGETNEESVEAEAKR